MHRIPRTIMNAKAVLDLIEEIGVLKNLPRTGWLFRGIKNAESVADHCYRVSFLSMLLADVLTKQNVRLSVEKVMRIALLHEVAEARIGDVPFPALEYIPEDIKEAGEKAARRWEFYRKTRWTDLGNHTYGPGPVYWNSTCSGSSYPSCPRSTFVTFMNKRLTYFLGGRYV